MGEGPDVYVDPEEAGAREQLGKLQEVVQEGAMWTDWSRSYCSTKLFKWLDEQVSISKNNWLMASDEEARAIRYRTQTFAMVKAWIAAHIQAGNYAAIGVKKFHQEGVELEGLIKPPTDNSSSIIGQGA